MREEKVALLAGAYSLAMVLGALFFQYVIGVLPCEMCHWQRWPHDGAFFLGLGGAALFAARIIDRATLRLIVWLTLALIVATGLIGGWQAGLEWGWWPGPQSCSGPRFVLSAHMNLNAPVVSCDHPGWRLLGISLAGYNFLCSLGVAILGGLLLTNKIKLLVAALDRWAKS